MALGSVVFLIEDVECGGFPGFCVSPGVAVIYLGWLPSVVFGLAAAWHAFDAVVRSAGDRRMGVIAGGCAVVALVVAAYAASFVE
jgi:hypothetical protein